ncbi:patatin-like phospholipase family protein [Enterovirga rhinocerotis]|uniref:NTE family protein n=1 Tax=Enterovirga rhinocerotis TaxID=1339210 RepID=A0A4R7BQZ8_9HYPH|nr:patatin-like phospholipase family protein [Enterovirga rhinocerotis]TDR88058.1 NTE family protein [Enterovirga rhinocerotis]
MSGRGSRRRKPGELAPPGGLRGPKAEKCVSLALQGGGAHGAFTWGVLDALIEDGRLAFEAISGASAGAMNAVVMTDGWEEGGPDGARAKLEAFWRQVSYDGSLSSPQRRIMDVFLDVWSPFTSSALFDFWRGTLSPTDANPLDVNPLRDVLASIIDFDRVRAAPVKLFISATRVWSGKIKLFRTPELTADHVMASACLPTIFRAVEIEGEPYWDGGYMGNPALYPLYYGVEADDVLLVQINPIERRETPKGMKEIQNRLTEVTFNSGLLQELRVLDFVTRLVDQGKLSEDEYKRVKMHRIDGGDDIARYLASSRMNASWDFFVELRDLGRRSAMIWIDAHYPAIGHRSTLDLRHAYA